MLINSTFKPSSLTSAEWEELINERVKMIFGNIKMFSTKRLGHDLVMTEGYYLRSLEEISPAPAMDHRDVFINHENISYNTQGTFVTVNSFSRKLNWLEDERRFFGFTRDKKLIMGIVGALKPARKMKQGRSSRVVELDYVYLAKANTPKALIERVGINEKQFLFLTSTIFAEWHRNTALRMGRINADYAKIETEGFLLEKCQEVPSDR